MKRVKIDGDVVTILWISITNPPQGEGFKGLERIERGISIKKKLRSVGIDEVLTINENGVELLKPPNEIKDWKPKKKFIDFETAEYMVLKNFLGKIEWMGRLEEVGKAMKAVKDAEDLDDKKEKKEKKKDASAD